jgi:two-component system sensor histidine kinase BaeS
MVVLDATIVSIALPSAQKDLGRVVDDLQHLAIADAGALAIHPEGCEVLKLLDQVALSQGDFASASEVNLVVDCDPELVVNADPMRFRQAVGNLVVNAIKFTRPSGLVTVSGRRVESEIVITVADTGIGIDRDDLRHVFDRFWRGEKSRNRATGGSGLGLSIARRLVEAHGGSAEAESEIGAGSVFTLRWPDTA